ncbi:hypothetical protein EGW08_021843 [Elysia chlorotica]|uniref:Uncharacterized protein n=1 Tax=Elysia chlorotica TaxID=188477 RepID=A0A433SMI4_ELYCH|nr:hypothetical protein EGW08_021843 [Elysia chlorotica]
MEFTVRASSPDIPPEPLPSLEVSGIGAVMEPYIPPTKSPMLLRARRRAARTRGQQSEDPGAWTEYLKVYTELGREKIEQSRKQQRLILQHEQVLIQQEEYYRRLNERMEEEDSLLGK